MSAAVGAAIALAVRADERHVVAAEERLDRDGEVRVALPVARLRLRPEQHHRARSASASACSSAASSADADGTATRDAASTVSAITAALRRQRPASITAVILRGARSRHAYRRTTAVRPMPLTSVAMHEPTAMLSRDVAILVSLPASSVHGTIALATMTRPVIQP